MKKMFFVFMMSFIVQISALAQRDFVSKTSDVLCLAPAATGLVKAIAEKDREGFMQLALSSATGIALNYGINACVAKDRPELPPNPGWSDHHAFPSTHSMAAFDGATFLMRRYGWQWGVPAYAAATYVAWSRVYTDHHDCWDVLAGAAIGAGSAFIYTRPFADKIDLTIAPISFGNAATGIYLSLNF